MSDSIEKRSLARTICLIATCTLALATSVMSTTGVTISLPVIGKELGIEEDQLQWLISAYSLTSGCLLIFFGRLADIYGRKKVFIFGAIILVAFSLGCSRAQTAVALDILRAMQGIGSAAMIPAAIGILAHSFPPSPSRAIAFATFSAGAPIGAGIGYVVSGLLTESTASTWRAFFYFGAAFGVIPILGALYSIDADRLFEEDDRRVDWGGAFLVTSALVLIIFVLSDGEIAPQGWKTSYIIACLVIGVILFAVFIWWQLYLERMQGNSQNNGRMAVIMTIAFLNWSCFISWAFWMILYYQEYLGLNPVSTVIRVLPMIVTGIICNAIVILIVSRIPAVYIIVCMTALTGTAAVLFAVIQPSAPYWAFGFPAMILSVAGADFVMSTGSLFVAKVALPHEQSLAGAVFQTMTQIGTAFGLTITTVIYDHVSRQHAEEMGGSADNVPPAAALAGYRAAQWGSVAFAVISIFLGAAFLRGVGIVGHRPKDDVAAPGADLEIQNLALKTLTVHKEAIKS